MRADNPNIKQLTLRLSESIIEQIDNLSYIASEFSNFAKMPEARPEEIDLTELLDRSTELYNNNHELTLRVNNHAAGRLMIMSDRSQLLRVFANLFENAKQAIPADRHGSIDVTLSCDGQYILIAISDNGIGISEEVSRRIFQPYFTTKSSGTGLGLAMTKKIIEFWKGEIWFETVENEGTTFYIRLPMLQETTA
jgi:signal transduction histidine kinase